MEQQLEQLKEKVRNMLMAADKPSRKLNLVDAVQHLGVAYHFQTEIAAVLQNLHKSYYQHAFEKANAEDLYHVALLFRLLRQEGYPVSCDMFNKFTDNRGKFQESLTDGVRGMLSLYEATHLRVHGEGLLEEALDFTTTHLNSALPNLSNNTIAAQVVHALDQPIHKGLTRLESRHYISFYEQDDSHNKVLLDFAKLDFDLLQKLHQRELSEITRWEITALDQLPEYMKLCYQALLDAYNMIDEEMAKEERSYCIDYAKFAMKDLVRAYFEEAKWCHEGYIPSMEEYMRVALVTGSYKMLATTSFVGMGDLVTKEAFEWVLSDPLILEAASVICRLMDDMVSHKFEQERRHVASAVECYMKQHGATEEEVLLEFQKRVTNAWKDMNAECLHPTAVPMPLLSRILNLARVINLLYTGEDGYTNSGKKVKKFVISVLVDSVPMN